MSEESDNPTTADMLRQTLRRTRARSEDLSVAVEQAMIRVQYLESALRGSMKLIAILLRRMPNSELVVSKEDAVNMDTSGSLVHWRTPDEDKLHWRWREKGEVPK